MGLVLVTTMLAGLVAACGSESTGQTSPAAVADTVRTFGGSGAKVYRTEALVDRSGDRKLDMLHIVVVCKSEDRCELVAPDGAGYPDVATFIEDTKLLDPGDGVTVNANATSPHARAIAKGYTKSADWKWTWYAIAGALVLLVVLTLLAVWLWPRRRGHRADSAAL